MSKLLMNRVESIAHDTRLALRRNVNIDDFSDYIDDDWFYNDINHEEKICSIWELKDAIELMNENQE